MEHELKAAELRGRAAGLLRSVLAAGGVNGAPLAFEGEGTTAIQLEAVRILREADGLLRAAVTERPVPYVWRWHSRLSDDEVGRLVRLSSEHEPTCLMVCAIWSLKHSDPRPVFRLECVTSHTCSPCKARARERLEARL